MREQHHISQRDLADALGISPQYLSDIERGARQAPSDDLLVHLADVLHARSDVLYFYAGRLPPDIAAMTASDETVSKAFRQLRLSLMGAQITMGAQESVPAKH